MMDNFAESKGNFKYEDAAPLVENMMGANTITHSPPRSSDSEWSDIDTDEMVIDVNDDEDDSGRSQIEVGRTQQTQKENSVLTSNSGGNHSLSITQESRLSDHSPSKESEG